MTETLSWRKRNTITQSTPQNGFSSQTNTFHTLRPPLPLPPQSQPLSIIDYTLSLLHSSTTTTAPKSTALLIDSATGNSLSYSEFSLQTKTLASSLQSLFPCLSKNTVAFILSPPSLHLPVLYFSLLSLGVIISPANPISSESEISHQIRISKAVIAFATSSTAHKIPSLPLGTILIDSPDFHSMISNSREKVHKKSIKINVNQSDSAAILYSSGTTGLVKAVELTHRNLISGITDFFHNRHRLEASRLHSVSLLTLPLFHVFGFFMLIRAVALGSTLVLMERFDFERMLEAVERYEVDHAPVSPPLVVALVKSDLVARYDLGSLRLIRCGGAPLGKELSERFNARFPKVEMVQGYGLTEFGGVVATMVDSDETKKLGSVGRLAANIEAKIVDPVSRNALPPGQRGEVWLRGPSVMKGYVGDDEATAATLDSEGWIKTGDLCYFDSDGFLYIVDRLKELIKYKAYQVPPAELEHLLQSNPQIADAAVIPYPHEEAGQIPMAFVVRKPGSGITKAQVMDFIAKQVAPYKKIRRVAFISAIPKSPAGKILRRELVNHALSGASSKL